MTVNRFSRRLPDGLGGQFAAISSAREIKINCAAWLVNPATGERSRIIPLSKDFSLKQKQLIDPAMIPTVTFRKADANIRYHTTCI